MKTFAKPCGLCKKLCQVSRKWWNGQRRSFYKAGMWAVRYGVVTEHEDGRLLIFLKWSRPGILCGCDVGEETA